MDLLHASDEEFIYKMTEIVVKHLSDDDFGVDELIRLSRLSKDIIRHRLKKISRKNITQFIAEIRLNKAQEMLQKESLPVNEVAWKTGFNSPEYFIRCYHDYFGHSPGEEKKRNHFIGISNDPRAVDEKKQEKPGKSGVQFRVYKRILYLLSGILVLFIFGDLGYFLIFKPSATKIPKNREITIAVLPFKNDSPDSNNVFFFNRLTETISEYLTKTGKFSVTPRQSVEQFRNNRTLTARQIAKVLKVDYLLHGSGLKTGDEVSLTIQLIKSRTDKIIFTLPFKEISLDNEYIYDIIGSEVASKVRGIVDSK